MIFIVQFTKRKFECEKMHLLCANDLQKIEISKENDEFFQKTQKVYVLEKCANSPFGKTFERRLLGREKKLEENFGSEETWESKKRPGAIFDHREPSRTEESGILDKNRRRIPNIRRVQLDCTHEY